MATAGRLRGLRVGLLLCLASLGWGGSASATEPAAAPRPPRELAAPVPEMRGLSTNSLATLDAAYPLAIGDLLSFRIAEDLEEPPKQLVVTDSGELEVPYLGRVAAQGKTCRQLAREMKAALEKDYYYQATVILAVDQRTKSRGKVYIVGPVPHPGLQTIPSDEILTVSKVILRAGGFTEFADRHNVRVTRQSPTARAGKRSLLVDVGRIFDKGQVELDVVVEPGDLIVVREHFLRLY